MPHEMAKLSNGMDAVFLAACSFYKNPSGRKIRFKYEKEGLLLTTLD